MTTFHHSYFSFRPLFHLSCNLYSSLPWVLFRKVFDTYLQIIDVFTSYNILSKFISYREMYTCENDLTFICSTNNEFPIFASLQVTYFTDFYCTVNSKMYIIRHTSLHWVLCIEFRSSKIRYNLQHLISIPK